MVLNTAKCQHINFTRKILPVATNYFIDGTKLLKVAHIRDLGVIIDSKLKFDVNVDSVT